MNEEVREFARGQVWKVIFGNGVGYETQASRPAIIVSSDYGAEVSPVLTVVYTTTTPKKNGTTVEVNSVFRDRSFALCSNIATIDKSRFTKYMGNLTSAEMCKVEMGLRNALSLPSKTDVDVSGYEQDIERLKQNISGLEVELEVHKRLYEKALEKLIDLRFERDVRESEPEPVIEVPQQVIEEAPELDLSGLAEKFNVHDERQKKREDVNEKLERKNAWAPKPDWVVANINNDSAKEIHEKTGLGLETARSIVRYRKVNGAFKDVSDLIDVPRFGRYSFDHYADKLEV